MTAAPRLVMVLTEDWTITPPRDLRALVRMAREAEDAGIDAVMLSDHLVLGASAGAQGRPGNPKAYAAPGNQDPATPWPDSVVLMSAIAAVTTRLRVVAGAIIAPLRHPVLLAHQLAALDLLSEGRLVVQPTASWHREEYDALGVPFGRRGRLLDEHLAAWKALWTGQPSREQMAPIREAMAAAGRSMDGLEVVGGLRPRFPDARSPADIDEAAEQVPDQLEQGYTSICFNPSQYCSDVDDVPALCRRLVSRVAA